jgi:hypothetical protein
MGWNTFQKFFVIGIVTIFNSVADFRIGYTWTILFHVKRIRNIWAQAWKILSWYHKIARMGDLNNVEDISHVFHWDLRVVDYVETNAEQQALLLHLKHQHNPMDHHKPNLKKYIVLFDIDIDIYFGFLTFLDILCRLCIVFMIFESFEPIRTELKPSDEIRSWIEIWIMAS